ncbi:ABC transporter permease [Aeromicrobium sp. A1-2]|uniref:ABC transporter permease n=1 Tax=Aeromicrobium sp. A1-2 TaxID=2107713 RepID=UPI000E4BAA80|nr:ABC transporter permease [Aeromicrobium sp. A1-2]AXT84260.1 ABC transporter permease [Aeromicrobium sp. A1-2]
MKRVEERRASTAVADGSAQISSMEPLNVWDEFRSRFLVPTIAAMSLAVLLVIGGATTPSFLTGENLLNIVQVASLIGIIAIGTTFLTLSGNFFSLSLQQTGAMCSIVFAAGVGTGWHWTFALIVALILGGLLGLIQGVIVAIGGNPIIVTIAAGAAIYGLASIVTGSRAQIIDRDQVAWLATAQPLGIPLTTWAFVLLAVIAQIVIVKTRFGRSVMLAGANRDTARSVGLPIGRISAGAFVISGVCAGLAGAFVAAQSNRGLVTNLDGANLEVVAAVLVGGTAIQGGEGSTLRTALGAVFIALLQNLLILQGWSTGPRQLAEGLAVVVGVSMFWIVKGGRKS